MVDFFEQALAPAPIPAEGISYAAKEIGTAIGIIAVLIMMFPVLSLLLDTSFFSSIIRPMPAPGLGSQRSLPVLSDYARHYQHFDLPVGHL